MAKKKIDPELFVTGRIPLMFLRSLTALYVFFMMVIYPIYYEDKYFNMGEAKWNFFKVVTFTGLSVLTALFIWYVIELLIHKELKSGVKKFIDDMSITDWFALSYLILVLISSALSPFKEGVLWGFDGWYMGLIAQVCFVLIYFYVSRFYRWDPFVIACYGLGALYVFIMGLLMRFDIDPMLMYENIDESYKLQFISTLGQTSWFSSYLVLIIPLSLFAMWHYDKKVIRVISIAFTSISFMSLVTQNSDSAFLALVGIFMMLFWLSFDSSKYFLRFLECVIVAAASFKFMGLCQVWFAEYAIQLDTLSIMASQSIYTWIILIASIALYVLFKYLVDKKNFDISKFKIVRVIVLVLLIVGIIVTGIYIYLNTTGQIAEKYLSDNNYLYFGDEWGNGRGRSWKCAVGTFAEMDLPLKLFGAGPDCFYYIVYTLFAETLNARWGENMVLVCAHNEWLNALINFGILGVTAYIGIFVASIKRSTANAKKCPEVLALAIAVVAYMSHNFFCYQQIICTPMIFIFMGIAEELVRKGYVREKGIL